MYGEGPRGIGGCIMFWPMEGVAAGCGAYALALLDDGRSESKDCC